MVVFSSSVLLGHIFQLHPQILISDINSWSSVPSFLHLLPSQGSTLQFWRVVAGLVNIIFLILAIALCFIKFPTVRPVRDELITGQPYGAVGRDGSHRHQSPGRGGEEFSTSSEDSSDLDVGRYRKTSSPSMSPSPGGRNYRGRREEGDAKAAKAEDKEEINSKKHHHHHRHREKDREDDGESPSRGKNKRNRGGTEALENAERGQRRRRGSTLDED